MTKKWLVFVVGLLIAAGLVFRLYRFGEVPVALYWDEVAIMIDARTVAATGSDMHGNHWLQAIFPSYGDYKLPVYIWFASLAVKFFGASEWTVRLPSLLAGIGTIALSGLIVYELFFQLKKQQRRNLSWLAAGIAAISPWGIVFSRIGFEGFLGQFFLGLSVWLILKSRTNKRWLLGAVIFGALATYTYFSIRFVWPVLLVLGLWFVSDLQKKTIKADLGKLFGQLIVSLLIYAALIFPIFRSPLYEPSQQFRLSATSVLSSHDWALEANQYREQAGNTFIDRAIYHRHLLLLRELTSNYADHLDLSYLFFQGDDNLRHGTGQHGLFLSAMLVPFVVGWYGLANRKYWRQGFLLLGWWLIALLPASVPEETPHALRSLNALVPLTIVIGWGVWQLWRWFERSKTSAWFKKSLLLIGALWLMVGLKTFASDYFLVYPARSAAEWQDGYRQLAHEIWQQKNEAGEVWVEPFDDRFYLWLLAYEMPVEEIQKIEFEKYLTRDVANIKLDFITTYELNGFEKTLLLAGRKKFIEEELKYLGPAKLSETKIIYPTASQELFMTALINPIHEN